MSTGQTAKHQDAPDPQIDRLTNTRGERSRYAAADGARMLERRERQPPTVN
jgi:hypothetical protein